MKQRPKKKTSGGRTGAENRQAKGVRQAKTAGAGQGSTALARLDDPSKNTVGIAMTVLFFLVVLFTHTSVRIPLSIVSMAVVIWLNVRRSVKAVLPRRISPVAILIFIYVLFCCVSGFYALSGKFALSELSKLLMSLGVFFAVLYRGSPGEAGARFLAKIFTVVSGVFGILSIEASSTQGFTNLFKTIMSGVAGEYNLPTGFEEGTRITSIFNNPNVFAGLAGLGTVLSVYLVISAVSKSEKCFARTVLAINGLAFLLAFSLGGIMAFVAALVVYLVFSPREHRMRTFVLLVIAAITTLIMAFLSFLGLGKTGEAVAFLPLLAIVLNAVLLNVVDGTLGEKITESFARHRGKSRAFVLAVVVIIVAYLIAALNVTGSASLAPWQTLRRSAYLAPGSYTLQGQSSEAAVVTVESQNIREVMMHSSTVLYSGDLASASFQVPEDSKVVYLNFSGADRSKPLTLDSVRYSGAGNGSVKLGYPLLPDFMANRLQGLRTNQNAVQRVVFFQDGLKIFAQSPVVGNGMGSFENAVKAVEEFYYETKYVHNHYIQLLVETGVVGLVIFVLLLVAVFKALIKNRKRRDTPALAPALLAMMAMLCIHGAVEVTLSAEAYLPFAFFLFAMVALYYGDSVAKEATAKETAGKIALGWRVAVIVFAAVFLASVAGNQIAKSTVKSDPMKIITDIDTLSRMDVYEKNDYLASYVMNAPFMGSQEVLDRAKLIAEDLSKVKSNSMGGLLTEFYFRTGEDDKAFAAARNGVAYTKSDPTAWQQYVEIFQKPLMPTESPTDQAAVAQSYQRIDNAATYADKVLAYYGELVEMNKTRMETVMLSDRNNHFIAKMMVLQADPGDFNHRAAVLHDTAMDTGTFADCDSDGIPDLFHMTQGGIAQSANGWTVAAGSEMAFDLYFHSEGIYKLVIDADDLSGVSAVTLNGDDIPLGRAEGERTEIKAPAYVEATMKISFERDTEIRSITIKR